MIALIAAIAENNCIGKQGTLPWNIPEDLAHFKKITTGNIVLMGRKTWESIPEKFRPLPHRTNIIISHQKNLNLPDNVLLYHTVDDALNKHSGEHIFIIGGAELYTQTILKANILYITHVHYNVDGDTFFPKIDMDIWQETEREDHDGFSFVTYNRI